MTLPSILAEAASAAPNRLNPVRLFLDADIVVQLVMVGLILASIWTWAIIVSFSLRMGAVARRSKAFERDFLKTDHPDRLLEGRHIRDNPSARVASAGLDELRHSTGADGRVRDKDGTKARVALAMEGQVSAEADSLAERLNFLATTGAVAPFVGLFAAIPAVIAYNRFSHRVNSYEARLQRFADRVSSHIGRELETL
jgi:biopolymer transport protein TolQ